MFDEASLIHALADLGYRRLKRHTYRADWSTGVEHFIYFQLYGTPADFLAASFGIRTKESERFAIQSIQTYGSEVDRRFRRHDERSDCYMRGSLGQLASWGMRSSLTVSSMSGPALAAKIKHDIEALLFPVIRGITSLDLLLSFWLTDAEPCPWYRCNGAMRAAMIVNVARRVGVAPAEIRKLLEPHLREIGRPHLHRAREPDPGRYVDNVIRDAFVETLPGSA
jgi:hypothetical protein